MASVGVSDLQHRLRRQLGEATDLAVAALVEAGQIDGVAELTGWSNRAHLSDPPLNDESAHLLTRLRELAATLDVADEPSVDQRRALRHAERALVAARRRQLPGPSLDPAASPALVNGVDAAPEQDVLLLRCDRGQVRAFWSSPDGWSTAPLCPVETFEAPARTLRLACETSFTRPAGVAVVFQAAQSLREHFLDGGVPLLEGPSLQVVADTRLAPLPWSLLSDRPVRLSLGLGQVRGRPSSDQTQPGSAHRRS